MIAVAVTASLAFMAGQPLSQSVPIARAWVSATEKSFYDFNAKELVSNADVPLSQFRGKVSLVVNVASK